MIVGTIAVLMYFFGSSGGMFGILMTKYAEEPIKIVIMDEERQEMALESLSILDDDIDLLNKQIVEGVEQFSSLVEDYNSTPEEFHNLFSETFAERKDQIDSLLKHRSNLLANIEHDEWEEIIDSAKSAAQEE